MTDGTLMLVSVIGTIIAFLLIVAILDPVARWIGYGINRWLCWREIRRAR